ALGLSAWANGVNSVALGAGSRAPEADTVSIGNGTGTGGYPATRRITNLAAGINATDAVNVAQLEAAVGDVVDLVDGVVTYDDASRGTVTLEGASGTRLTNLAAGQVTATSSDATTGAQLHAALSSAADIVGGGATVTAFGTLSAPTYSIGGANYFSIGDALGALDAQIGTLDQRVAGVEQSARIAATPAPASVTTPVAAEPATVAATPAVAESGTTVGEGATANADSGTAVGGGAYAHGPNDTAIGSNVRVDADGSTAVGANSAISAVATNAVALGESASVSAASGTAVGQGASVSAEGAVALGQGSVADRANTVSVGATGSERQVTNVAAGIQATDAANVGQVQAGVAEARAYADTTATQAVSTANAYTDQKFDAWGQNLDTLRGDVERRFYDTDRRIDRQGAMGAAMLNMATSAAGIRTQNRVGVGVGFQGGESALSVGYQRAISERATVTFGGALSGDEKSVGVGAGFGW
ncbi:YadA-like family protein, partial [Luteimonas sp. XNQY3]